MKASYKSESDFESDFCKILSDNGWLALKLTGPRGWPDRTVISPRGEQYYVEFKNPNNRGVLSKAQVWWGSKLEDMRHRYFVVDSIEEAENILFNWLGAKYVNHKMGTTPVPKDSTGLR